MQYRLQAAIDNAAAAAAVVSVNNAATAAAKAAASATHIGWLDHAKPMPAGHMATEAAPLTAHAAAAAVHAAAGADRCFTAVHQLHCSTSVASILRCTLTTSTS